MCRRWWRPVRKQLLEGILGAVEDFPHLVMELLEVLEEVKLELANLRLTILRPVVVEAAIKWEQSMVASMMLDGSASLPKTINAIQHTAKQLKATSVRSSCCMLHSELIVGLLTSEIPSPIPEVFYSDADNILQWRNKLERVLLLSSLWPIGQTVLNSCNVEMTAPHIRRIRSTILEGKIEWNNHAAWALEFFHLLHACATEQGKTIPSSTTTHLISAANPAGPLRKLLMTRIQQILRSSFGGESMDETQTARAAKSFSCAGTELATVVEAAAATTAYLSVLYRPMYIPFVQDAHPDSAQTAKQAAVLTAIQPVSSLSSQVHDSDDDDDELPPCASRPSRAFQLSAPGLKPLSYNRATSGRARSCGPSILEPPGMSSEMRRQTTLDAVLISVHRQSSTEVSINK